MNKINNEYLTVSINNSGAEVYSIIDKTTGTEYMWNGNPMIWGRHSPILFPIVGRLKNNAYTVNGQKYTLPQHGFARDMEFTVESNTSDKIVFSLVSNSDTLQKYPYSFKLEITYELEAKKLTVSYRVTNLQDSTMHFSIGAHPGFKYPLHDNESMEEYYLEFEKPETLDLWQLENGLISDDKVPYLKNETKIPLSSSLFKNDALIFANYRSSYMSLKHQSKGEVFKFYFANYPFLGIWSKPGPFVCIEPWYGIADHIDHNGDLTTKKGILPLPSGEVFNCNWAVEFS